MGLSRHEDDFEWEHSIRENFINYIKIFEDLACWKSILKRMSNYSKKSPNNLFGECNLSFEIKWAGLLWLLILYYNIFSILIDYFYDYPF